MKHDYHDFGGAFNDGYQLRPLLPWRWLFLVLLFVAYCANAQVTYTYLGQPMAGQVTSGLPGNPDDITILSGTVTLAQPLNPNAVNQVVTPLSYFFTSGILSSNGPNPNGPQTFSFTTQNGLIMAWSISIGGATPAYGSVQAMTTTEAGDTYNVRDFLSWCGQPSIPGPSWQCSTYTAFSSTPGAWSVDMATMAALQARLATMQTAYTTYYNGYLSVRTSDLSWMSRAITDEDKESAVIINCRDKKGAC